MWFTFKTGTFLVFSGILHRKVNKSHIFIVFSPFFRSDLECTAHLPSSTVLFVAVRADLTTRVGVLNGI